MPPWLSFLAVVTIWGSTWFVITTQLAVIPANWAVAYRFLLAAAVLWLVLLVRRERLALTMRQHALVALFGLLQFSLNYLLVYEAETHISSGLVAVVFALMVVTNPAIARLTIGQKMSPALYLGAALSVTGIGLLYAREVTTLDWHDRGIVGLALCFGGVLAASAGNIFPAAKSLRGVSINALNAWGMVYGAIGSSIYAAFTDGPAPWSLEPRFLLGLGYLSILGSVVTFTLYLQLIRQWGVARAGYTSVLIPVVALAISTVLEGYQWSTLGLIGAGLALAGTLVAVASRR
ncbi:DMT family transporter [Parapedomonas caeni]